MVSLLAPSQVGKNITCGYDPVFAKLPDTQLKVQFLKKKFTGESWYRNRRNCVRGMQGATLTCECKTSECEVVQLSRPADVETVVL